MHNTERLKIADTETIEFMCQIPEALMREDYARIVMWSTGN
jgi:hypothetical protein